MRKGNVKLQILLAFVIGVPLVVWVGLKIAPSLDDGLLAILLALGESFNSFEITICDNTLSCVGLLVLVYALCLGVYFSTRKNYRRNEEHGSAKWGDPKELDRRYRQIDKKKPKGEEAKEAAAKNHAYKERNNIILTENVMLGLDAKKHRRNLNIVVIGGSGAGKTRFLVKPNLMQCPDCSFIVLDPKGEILRDVGGFLKEQGYVIHVLNLVEPEQSDCYNPFVYLHNDNDVQRLVTNLFKATTPKGSSSSDPFWDTAASMLLMALVFYLHYEAPEEEQNFAMVMDMLRYGAVEDEDSDDPSPLDMLFDELEAKKPEHIALKYYRNYRSGAAKTIKSIQITLAARLEKFNLRSLADLTSFDQLDLPSMCERKSVLFAVIPDNDSSFNFLVSILYTQLFQQLFYVADHVHKGRLKVPVHFWMDEFANISLPDDFDKVLATARSRGVSFSIILQNLSQLKTLFEKQWESIMGNCDTFLFLGGNEQSSHKYVSELLGKETIDTDTHGKTSGSHGSWSTNYQNTGRELLLPDEVRTMNNNDAILLIRGEKPVMDKKYEILKHPNIEGTADGKQGKAKEYVHGVFVPNATISIELNESDALDSLYEYDNGGLPDDGEKHSFVLLDIEDDDSEPMP